MKKTILFLGLIAATTIMFFACDNGTTPQDNEKKYRIIFQGNGGSTPDEKVGKMNEVIKLPSSTRSGYTLTGWYDKKSGGTLKGKAGGDYTIKGAVYLYAQWESKVTPINCNNIKLTLHKNIMASTFWLNEGPSEYNGYITNTTTAWSDLEKNKRFTVNGKNAEDNPRKAAKRDKDHIIEGYDGKENPYYYALPYDDMDNLVFEDYDAPKSKLDAVAALSDDYSVKEQDVLTKAFSSSRKQNAQCIPWYDKDDLAGKSVVKGRWIKVKLSSKPDKPENWVYAQWLDAGPYHYDDLDYILGDNRPRNESSNIGTEPNAGIDLSPAVMLKMGISADDLDTPWGGTNREVDWQFVEEDEALKDKGNKPWNKFVSDNKCYW